MNGLTSFESKLFFVLTVLWAGFCVLALLYSMSHSSAHFFPIVLPGTVIFVAIVRGSRELAPVAIANRRVLLLAAALLSLR